MVRGRLRKLATGCLLASAALALAACQPALGIRTYFERLAVRETLLPMAWGTVSPTPAGFMMGDLSALGAPSGWTITWNVPVNGPLPGGNVPETLQTISYRFNISKYEITNELYAQFIADGGYSKSEYWTTNGWAWLASKGYTEPDRWQDSNFNLPTQPVGVSWYEAVAFCNWRSVIEGLTPAYNAAGKADLAASGYRLPTEVEWEYAAAKAGGSGETVFPWGNTWDSSKAVCSVSPSFYTKTAVVGSIPAGDSRGGASDIAGNVWEWCSDNFQPDASVAPSADRYYFVDDTTTSDFVSRGGLFSYPIPEVFRCAYRWGRVPIVRGNGQGFRIVHR